MIRTASLCVVALLCAGALRADDAATFFDDSAVREIRLYFDDPNWYNTLFQSHSSNPDDPYFPARLQYGNLVLPRIGARFKGESSFRRNGIKKSFKLDFNEYDDNATFFGLKKLNLNNGDLQPDFLHEKLFLDFAGRYIAAMRAAHVRLYINDAYYGLYIAIEQPDKTMMRSRFGDDEDGNLYEAGESAAATMAYLGTSPAAYASRYELKNNEEENDYSGLVELLDILNNTPAASLPERLEPVMDVENFLWGMALNTLFTNLESYVGSAAEYYLYDRTRDGRFIHIHWDLNETFGSTGDGTPRLSNPYTMDPFYLPTAGVGPQPGGGPGGTARPLLEKLWAVDAYKRAYLQMLAAMLREGFDETTVAARVQELAGRIREHVYADSKKVYTNAQFETALTSRVTANGFTTYGLTEFVRERANYLRPVLGNYVRPADVRFSEIAAGADPWVELQNPGPGTVTTDGFYLTDDPAVPTRWQLPVRTLADGDYLLLRPEGETFRLNPAGGKLYLFAAAVSLQTAIDTVTYAAAVSGASWARTGYTGSVWSATFTPTPGARNAITAASAPAVPSNGTGLLLINEFMADNDAAVPDPDEAGAFEDWFEVYNPGSPAVDMSGMYITDNLQNPTKWQVPAGVSIPAGGHLVFVADGETAQGSRHTSWSLSTNGEEIGIFAADGKTLIDSVAFGPQRTDIAYGRTTDGAASWSLFAPATPGAANASPLANWILNAASLTPGPLAPEGMASLFGQNLAGAEASAASVPLPTTLAGITVAITDSAGAARPAPLVYAGPRQVNLLIPEGMARGRASVSLRRGDGTTVGGEIFIDPIGPGVFSANANGSGAGALAAVRVDAQGHQTALDPVRYDPAQAKYVAAPISLGAATDAVYLVLYGTGIRGAKAASGVAAQVGGVTVPITWAGAHGAYPGLDQVNIGPLPRSLATKGEIPVLLTVDGERANAVTVAIE